ncbi:MAG: fasciclin domain-containing protein, partial [Bacteroidaceae bacterium]|nr:fasciclin domain-containing protein [Bacteroidaceae bacterium]
MKKPFGIKMKVLAFSALALMASSTFTSCSDEPDEDSRFTFTGELIADHLKNNPDKYSNFCKILEQAKIGKKAGSMLTTLSTYGSYTCFAPTNEAVERYIQAKYNEYKASVDSFNANPEEYRIKHTGITSPRLEDLSDSMAAVIAKNHIIEQGFTTIEVGNGAFPKKTMNRRSVMLGWSTDKQGYSIATVDGVEMLEQNIKTENGYVHCINGALTPSDQPTPSLLASQGQFSLFSEALTTTGLDEYLSLYETHPDYDGIGLFGPYFQTQKQEPPYPETNNQGFTLLVETNDLFADPSKNSLGISIQSIEDLEWFAANWYGNITDKNEKTFDYKGDYSNPNNPLYKFVAYHIIDRKLLYKSGKGPGGFIMEGYQTINQEGEIDKGKFDSEENMPTNFDRYDYFETALPYTSIKITKTYTNNSELKNALVANYAQEMGTRCVVSGMELHTNVVIEDASTTIQRPGLEDFEQQAVNGMIYTIDKILVYNEVEMAGNVFDERMRWDVFSLFPELTNNDVRWVPQDAYTLTYIPEGYSTRLRHNNTDTNIYYLRPYNAGLGTSGNGYANYQGDEMLVTGKYDFQYRIPYVPQGSYEIRFGFSTSDARGVAQFYFGEEGKLQICGIPLDMRNSNQAFMGWFEESENEEENRKEDKSMRNRGFMKAPASFFGDGGGNLGVKNMRHAESAFRRIIGTYELNHGKNYWLR